MKKGESPVIYRFVLYIAGENASAKRASENLQSICAEYVPDKYSIDVVDLKATPDIIMEDQILAVPMVIRKAPLPEVRIIGDLSDREKAVKALGIGKEPTRSVPEKA